MFILLSISFASAAQNDTQVTDDNEILTVTEETLQTEETDEITSKNNDENNLTADVGTYTELEQAFLVNDKFVFEKDYAAHAGDGIINIKRSIEIDGNGHTINAGEFTGIFQADSSASNGINVVIKNLILKSGRKEQGTAIGGAILVKNVENVHFNIINCTFINNRAGSYGGAIYFSSDGGAIDISNSKFTTNNANGDGGTIYLDGECSGIRNSIFENNWATSSDGGAIYIASGNKNGVVIENCKFTKNQVIVDGSGKLGGAICNKGKGNLRILNSEFDSNQIIGLKPGYDDAKFSDKKGGAVYSENKLELGGCNFNNNYAHDCGGAVYADVLVWLEQPSKFTNNHVYTENAIAANKGGAIYASTFQNTAKGLIFINNKGYYGGAIYINNKNDVTFQSCYFEGNTALTGSKTHGSGAAIYVDSSGSTVTLVDNSFVNNKATSDSGVFNCGKFGTVANNWWGSNNPDFNNAKYLVEWHRFKSNDIIKDEKYLRAVATDTQLYGSIGHPAGFKIYFVNNKGETFTGKLTNLNMDISATGGGYFVEKSVGDNGATVIFSPTGKFGTLITVQINQERISVFMNRIGDFTYLQREIDAANGTLNLSGNYHYSGKALEKITDGIVINKPITINGNGHRIVANSETRIFNIQSDNVTINNIRFGNGNHANSGGAITVNGKNIKIMNSNFNDNHASGTGGAINIEGGSDIQIIGCTFIRNAAYNHEGGGAIFINASNVKIEKSVFQGNVGPKGGAIDIRAENVAIDSCEFRYNHASAKEGGGAISNSAKNVEIKNSVFLDNSEILEKIDYEIKNDTITFTLVGAENYMNAIFSSNNITFSNVTYWDGATTTSSNPPCSKFEKGISMGIDIIDDKNKTIKQVGLKTDNQGHASYNYSNLSAGNYKFKAYHSLDSYYRPIETTGTFNVSGTKKTYPSEVKINLKNGTEFSFGKHNITFEVTNKTIVEVVITNSDFTRVFYDNETNLNYVTVDLPASDEYYNIIVFNQGNATYDPTSDEKAFKILKLNSTVKINPISNLNYTDPVTITFTGDGASYNVTVYDENSTIIFSQITGENSVKIPDMLSTGRYNATVINLGDENRTQSRDSIKFNISKKNNEIKVIVANATYGESVQINITAQIDGNYKVYINNTEIIVNVFEGRGAKILELAAGRYTTNVTYDDPNYNNVIETQDFTVQKAQSDVSLNLGNVAFNQSTAVSIYDNFPTEYNVTLYDSGNNIIFNEVINETKFTIPALINGEYNLTVVNLGNENITGSENSTVFDVTTDNYVEIIVYDEYYGRELLVIILADVNGYYTVDINGTELTIEVEDGLGYDDTLELNAGEYYANVTFDNPDYNNIIENTTFTIYPAESNLEIYDIENITYSEEVTIEYYDDYNTLFNVVIFDKNEDVVFDIYTNATIVIVSDLAAGEYTAMITNPGNENIIGISEFKNFTVEKATPNMEATTENITYPDDLVVTVLSDVNGNYTIEFADKTQTITLQANKECEIVYPELTPGDYEFKVTFAGNENYTDASVTVPITVHKADSELKVTTAVDDRDVNITATLNVNATGNVEISIAGKKFYAPIINGTAIFSNSYPAGIYVANVTYPGDDNFKSANKNVQFSISEIIPILNNTPITIDVYTDENEVQITVNVNETATGLIEIKIDDEDIVYLPINNGKVFEDVLLPAGNYTVTATYLGDDNYNPNTTSTDFEVFGHIKQNTTITATPKVDENTVTITVEVNESATGFVEITIAGKKYYAPVENGKAVFTNDYANGTYTANITYLGDDNYNTANTKTQFSIIETEPTFDNTTIEIDVSSVENDVTIKVSVNPNATGLIEINIDGDAVYLPVNNGKVIYEVLLAGGNYTATATYLGDANYNPNTTAKDFEVFDHTKQNTTITATPKVDENTVTITVEVNESATGFVEITIAGKKYYAPVENGKAVFTNDYANGTYTANITYLGDDNYNTANTKTQFSIIETEPTFDNTTIEMDISTDENIATITVTVNTDATGLIEINIDGDAVYLPINNGEVNYEVLLPGGNHTATATYLGDANYNPNTTTKDFEVFDHTKQNTTITATPKVDKNTVTITVNVNPNATGFVEITITGKKYYAPIKDGKAIFTNDYANGTYSASITYLGDDNYTTANTKTQFTVIDHTPEKKNTTIEIDVVTDDNNVTITVEVNESATGLIEVNIDGNAVYLPVTNGQVVYEAVAPAGNYTATATYLGDDIFNSNATSFSFNVTDHVVENTTFEVEYSVNGTNVTITITSNVDGEVTVYLDGIESTVKLDNGTATFTVPSMEYGEHSLVISYPGDYNHKPTVDVKQIYLEAFDTKFANITIEKDTLTAYLVISTGDVLANQSITLIIDGNEYNATTNADGMIQIEDILNSIMELKFEGDGPFMPTSVEINLKNITVERETTEIMSKDLTQYACDFYEGERGGNFTFRLIDSKGKAIANETIYIGYNGVTYNRTTDENGYANVQINLKNAGLYTFVVVYLGSDKYEASMSVHKITINKKKTAITAPAKTYKVSTKTKKYTVTLKTNKGSSADGKTYLAKGKKITLKVNGKTYTAKTNAKGQATFKITNLKKKGKFTATIKFAGDNTYNAASKKSKLTIK